MLYLEKIYSYLKRCIGDVEDGTYDAFITESVQEAAIERGLGFKVQFQNMAHLSGATDKYLIRIPQGELITLGIESLICVDSSTAHESFSKLNLYEGCTYSNVGLETGVIITNYNRNHLDSNGFLITSAPTITTNGELLMTTIASSLATSTPNLSFQLKQNTNYLLEIQNMSAVTNSYVSSNYVYQLPLD